MSYNTTSTEKGIIAALLGFAAFSISDGLRKLAALDYTVIDILFWQAIFGMILLCLLSRFLGGIESLITSKNRTWHILRGLFMAGNTSLSMAALALIPIVDAYTIYFLAPFVISILGALLFKEKMGKYRMMSILLGFIGALIAFRPGFTEMNTAYLLALGVVFTFSCASLIARHMANIHSLISFGFWPMLFTALWAVIYRGGYVPVHDLYFMFLCFTIGTFYSIGLMSTAYAFSVAPSSIIAPYNYTQMIFALGFGFFVFGNIPDFFKMLGASIIVGSGIFFFMRERKSNIRLRP